MTSFYSGGYRGDSCGSLESPFETKLFHFHGKFPENQHKLSNNQVFQVIRFPVPIDFKSCREEIAGALQEFCNRWCKREHVESNALNSWKLNIFKIIDGRISFYCNNLDLLPPKPKFTFRHLKKGIQEFHRKFVLAPADKAANNVVVV